MSLLSSSPFSLMAVLLQINDDGFTVNGMASIDEGENWIARSRLLALRDSGDTTLFETATLSGARILYSYNVDAHVVPVNNDLILDSIYKRVLRKTITLSGSTMDSTDFNSLYTAYITAQNYWARRNQLIAQLADGEITYLKAVDFIADLVALTKPTIALVSPLLTENVTFDEGGSCSFNSYTADIVTGFSFTLSSDTDLV